ncbi:hypothetical protein KC19_VG058500 [Ceratodon purpureus]|uniref:Uncharacterized protein n=1 Tax=Ceratodon purpureus TaxID=3225 RepID=A0A8T0HMC5_CERPU|nr:hypothetical protein KC19_VG058500 [Ceratodon purpureus]
MLYSQIRDLPNFHLLLLHEQLHLYIHLPSRSGFVCALHTASRMSRPGPRNVLEAITCLDCRGILEHDIPENRQDD